MGAVAQGYVEITSSGIRLVGNLILAGAAQDDIAALPLASTLQESVLFPHLVSDQAYFTSITILNPNVTDAIATIEIYTADGRLDSSISEIIPARQRKSRLLTEYFPHLVGKNRTSGHIRLSVDRGVASFALFGSHDSSILAAIPPQTIP